MWFCALLVGYLTVISFSTTEELLSPITDEHRSERNILEIESSFPTKYGISLWNGRIIVVPKKKDMSALKEQKSYRVCIASTAEIGYCSRLSECKGFSISSLHNNICFLDMFVPGVCCPQRLLRPSIIWLTPATTTTSTSAPVTKKVVTTVTEKTVQPSKSGVHTNKTSSSQSKKTEKCGVNSSPSSRIVHGKRSNSGDWPWMAALFANTFLGKKFHCGGSLISEKHVLTGAHCVKDQRGMTFSPQQIAVRLGDTDISSLRDSDRSGRFYSLQEIRAHPDFRNINHYFLNDVAVLWLKDKVRISDTMFPICLPSPAIKNGPLDMFTDRYATVTGFGRTEIGLPSKNLLEAKVPIWKNKDCDGAYFAPITDIFICAGYRSGGIDACQGDSGGPLQIEEDNRWMQIGITSFGKGCGEPGFPGVYTRVSKFLAWIEKNMS